MKRNDRVEWIAQTVFYILGLIIVAKMVITIIKPVSIAVDTEYKKGFYENILSKSTASLEVTGNSDEEEEKSDLFPMVFKYITGIDIGNPKTYIASQIPILGLFDITAITSNEEGPVVVVPRDDVNSTDNNNSPSKNEETKNTDKSNTVPEKNNNGGASAKHGGEEIIEPGNVTTPKKKNLDPSKPLVLIYHTHIAEAYNPNDIENGNHSRNMDLGVARVGENVRKELESKYGVATIHDTTIFDFPTLGKGYARARPTIQSYIKKYPSLKLIIDLHRDSATEANTTTAIINGKRYARIMFVFGAKNKNINNNKEFTKKLSACFDKYYPKLLKGSYWKNVSIYNQDLTPKLVILEVGSNKNSLDEALKTSEIIAKMIAVFLK